ncbi:MAG: hypothetical protein JNM96_04015 [Bacteroidia bacterium]|nr:hypothetical protein [Bacteroidia bacterium]
MPFEVPKKQGRTPLTAEQIKDIIAYKKQKELRLLLKFKKTRKYKVLNVFNIICVLIYCEVIFCMYGPAKYTALVCEKAIAEYGIVVNGKSTIDFLNVYSTEGNSYKFSIGEYIQIPKPNTVFYVGKDFLLNKEIKGMVITSAEEYQLWRVTPLIFLGIFVTLVTMLVFFHNMNMINYSLIAISWLNAINLLYFIVI